MQSVTNIFDQLRLSPPIPGPLHKRTVDAADLGTTAEVLRSLMPSFESKRQAMRTVRRYVMQHDRTRPSMFRILKMKV